MAGGRSTGRPGDRNARIPVPRSHGLPEQGQANAKCQMSNAEWRVPSPECRVPGCCVANAVSRMPSAECRVQNAERRVPSACLSSSSCADCQMGSFCHFARGRRRPGSRLRATGHWRRSRLKWLRFVILRAWARPPARRRSHAAAMRCPGKGTARSPDGTKMGLSSEAPAQRRRIRFVTRYVRQAAPSPDCRVPSDCLSSSSCADCQMGSFCHFVHGRRRPGSWLLATDPGRRHRPSLPAC